MLRELANRKAAEQTVKSEKLKVKSLKVPTEERQSRQFKVQGSRFIVQVMQIMQIMQILTLRVEIYETTADAGNLLNLLYSRLTLINTNYHKFYTLCVEIYNLERA